MLLRKEGQTRPPDKPAHISGGIARLSIAATPDAQSFLSLPLRAQHGNSGLLTLAGPDVNLRQANGYARATATGGNKNEGSSFA